MFLIYNSVNWCLSLVASPRVIDLFRDIPHPVFFPKHGSNNNDLVSCSNRCFKSLQKRWLFEKLENNCWSRNRRSESPSFTVNRCFYSVALLKLLILLIDIQFDPNAFNRLTLNKGLPRINFFVCIFSTFQVVVLPDILSRNVAIESIFE